MPKSARNARAECGLHGRPFGGGGLRIALPNTLNLAPKGLLVKNYSSPPTGGFSFPGE
ncbi:hypothetical protein EMIT0111MI5_10828 [Burkholderia sp. IT-111MI5]